MAREPGRVRRARRLATLRDYAKNLEERIDRFSDRPNVVNWRSRLEQTRRDIRILELHGELDDLQNPGDHSIEVPAGNLVADGKKAEG